MQRNVILALLAAAAGLAVSAPSETSAGNWQQVPGAVCRTGETDPNFQGRVINGTYVSSIGFFDAISASETVYCPIPSVDGGVHAANMTSASVSVHDAANPAAGGMGGAKFEIHASLCFEFFDGSSVFCGADAGTTSSFVGYSTLTLAKSSTGSALSADPIFIVGELGWGTVKRIRVSL